MIETFELAAEYSAIRDKPENYDVPHEDDFSDKDPNDLLEGQFSCWSGVVQADGMLASRCGGRSGE